MEKVIQIGNRNYNISSDDSYLDAVGNSFEPYMVELFDALICEDDVVADIGANIGLTSILFSTLSEKVFSFEPSPTTYALLKENLLQAGVSNVVPINLGLGDKREEMTITFARNNRSGGYVSDKIRPESGHITENIEIDKIDNYFFENDIHPSFIKIDVEGFEKNVISGGLKFIENKKPVVVMEMNHFCLGVLQRITIPDFLDYMLSTFPYLYAVDSNNSTIANLHDSEQAYFVMHEHVVRHRFPNIVGGYDASIKNKLEKMVSKSSSIAHSIAGNANFYSKIGLLKKKVIFVVTDLPRRFGFNTPLVKSPAGFIRASITTIEQVVSNEQFEIPITIGNIGEEVWHGSGSHPVVLCYHWKNTDGSYYIYDGIRTRMKMNIVKPGHTVSDVIRVVAPNKCGDFDLIITVLQEGSCWFEDKGFEVSCKKVKVVCQ